MEFSQKIEAKSHKTWPRKTKSVRKKKGRKFSQLDSEPEKKDQLKQFQNKSQLFYFILEEDDDASARKKKKTFFDDGLG